MSPAQRDLLDRIRQWADKGGYRPRGREWRTLGVLHRNALVECRNGTWYAA